MKSSPSQKLPLNAETVIPQRCFETEKRLAVQSRVLLFAACVEQVVKVLLLNPFSHLLPSEPHSEMAYLSILKSFWWKENRGREGESKRVSRTTTKAFNERCAHCGGNLPSLLKNVPASFNLISDETFIKIFQHCMEVCFVCFFPLPLSFFTFRNSKWVQREVKRMPRSTKVIVCQLANCDFEI